MGFLKFVGVVNAAIWLGGALAFTLVVVPGFFSPAMLGLLPKSHAGAAAQIIIERCFVLQHVCGFIGILHALAGWLYLGRPLRSLTNYLLVIVFCLGLIGSVGIAPKLRQLHLQKYGVRSTPAERAAADHTFKMYHGLARVLDLIAIGGIAVYFWRVTYASDTARYAPVNKLRS